MKVIMLPISEVLNYWSSDIEGDEWQLELLEAKLDEGLIRVLSSIEERGYDRRFPLFVYKAYDDEWHIANGHHRLLAAILLGMDEIPVSNSQDMSAWTLDDSVEFDWVLTEAQQKELEQMSDFFLVDR